MPLSVLPSHAIAATVGSAGRRGSMDTGPAVAEDRQGVAVER